MLGSYLKSLRESKGLSQREVERRTGISNAFLSQMESGKVKEPSPLILYKLSNEYGVPYEALMERAGYPVSSGQASLSRKGEGVFHRLGKVTPDEEQELLDYLKFLRSRGKRSGRK